MLKKLKSSFYSIIETYTILLLRIGHAFKIKPYSCPPKCSEQHTYKFPCLMRNSNLWYRKDRSI